MGLFKGKDKLSIFQRKHETYLYELVMEEIANNERQKGIWGQAIVKSNGDEKKAEAEYIKLRVEALKDEIEIQKQEETEKQILNEELEKLAEEKENKKIIENATDKRVFTVSVTISFVAFLIILVLIANS